jgi:hypothetical protein
MTCGAIFHDDSIYNLAILLEVACEIVCMSKKCKQKNTEAARTLIAAPPKINNVEMRVNPVIRLQITITATK